MTQDIIKPISTSRFLNFVSINDLREKELDGDKLSETQYKALYNYDRYRIAELSKTADEKTYHQRYCQLRISAQLVAYEEFLEKKYSM